MPKAVKTIWSSFLLSGLLLIIFVMPLLPISSNKAVDAPFLDSQASEKAIVFFGFSHCADVCPATLAILRNLMNNLEKQDAWPQVAFVDIDLDSNQPNAEQYAKQFHSKFVGVHPQPELMAKLSADFGLNIRQLDDQIAHRGRTYLLNRKADQWHLVKTYNPDTFDQKSLEKDLYL